ncbi:hypothetical protein ACLOJK_018431, partial [Asimina triloba]
DRCTSSAGGEAGEQHSYCSCGKHCSCNPCRRAKTEEATPTGKAFCKCGEVALVLHAPLKKPVHRWPS